MSMYHTRRSFLEGSYTKIKLMIKNFDRYLFNKETYKPVCCGSVYTKEAF